MAYLPDRFEEAKAERVTPGWQKFLLGFTAAVVVAGVAAQVITRVRRVRGQTATWRGWWPRSGAIVQYWPEKGEWITVADIYKGLGYNELIYPNGLGWLVYTLPPKGEAPFVTIREAETLKPPWPWDVEILHKGFVPRAELDALPLRYRSRATEMAAERWIDEYVRGGGEVPEPGMRRSG